MEKFLAVLNQFLRFQKPDNLKVVVYCILTATTFWLFSALNKNYNASVNYPVHWLFDTQQFIVTQELPEHIQINVSGLGWNLLRANSGIGLNPLNIRLPDPAGQKALPGSFFANQISEGLDELNLNYIIQDSLYFHIDVRVSQSFPVYIDSTHIELDEGYRITTPIQYDTELVEIEGPKQLISAMPKDTFWVKVIKTNIDEDFDQEVPVPLENPELMVAKPQTIHVTFGVNKFIQQEKEVPIHYTNLASIKNIFVKDSTITVAYLVQENLADSVQNDMFYVEANFNDINKADSTLNLSLTTTSPLIIEPYFNYPQVKVYYNE